MKFYFFLNIVSLYMFLSSCTPHDEKNIKDPASEKTKKLQLNYAKRYCIEYKKYYKIIKLFGDRNSEKETSVFIIYNHDSIKPKESLDAFYITTPLNKVASMSSIYSFMLTELGVSGKIAAIDNIDYYNNPIIIEAFQKKQIQELSKGPEMNIEQTIALHPDLILTYGMGNPKLDVNQKLLQMGVPVAISLDHLEETPLARAEWIKFFAAFFDKEALADSIFRQVEDRYLSIRHKTDSIKTHPGVLSELKYGDTWYVAGGKSYMANLIKDAGGHYIWEDINQSGSIPLTYEQVFEKARGADYWIHLFLCQNKKDVLSYDQRYASFKAFQTGQLYNNNKQCNPKGYLNYWERGISHPDELLSDLIFIFHPKLIPDHKLQYYQKLN